MRFIHWSELSTFIDHFIDREETGGGVSLYLPREGLRRDKRSLKTLVAMVTYAKSNAWDCN